jgi:hypothetical protein
MASEEPSSNGGGSASRLLETPAARALMQEQAQKKTKPKVQVAN